MESSAVVKLPKVGTNMSLGLSRPATVETAIENKGSAIPQFLPMVNKKRKIKITQPGCKYWLTAKRGGGGKYEEFSNNNSSESKSEDFIVIEVPMFSRLMSRLDQYATNKSLEAQKNGLDAKRELGYGFNYIADSLGRSYTFAQQVKAAVELMNALASEERSVRIAAINLKSGPHQSGELNKIFNDICLQMEKFKKITSDEDIDQSIGLRSLISSSLSNLVPYSSQRPPSPPPPPPPLSPPPQNSSAPPTVLPLAAALPPPPTSVPSTVLPLSALQIHQRMQAQNQHTFFSRRTFFMAGGLSGIYMFGFNYLAFIAAVAAYCGPELIGHLHERCKKIK